MRRPVKVAMVVSALLALSIAGCRRGLCMGKPGAAVAAPVAPAPALAWTTVPADEVEVMWSGRHHSTAFGVALPPPAAGEGNLRQVELRFGGSLQSAKVDVVGIGPRHRVALLDEKRVRGNAVAVPVPALTLERVEVVVHHHARAVPLPPQVRVAREVRR